MTYVLTDYIKAAMHQAHYEFLEENVYFGSIPGLNGVWADGKTLEECRDTLREVLEEWILIKLRDNDDNFPTINGHSLNPDDDTTIEAVAEAHEAWVALQDIKADLQAKAPVESGV